jgi:hypothetical protein
MTSLNNQRRAGKTEKEDIDLLEYELAAGWFFRGYGNMTPQKRADALKGRGFGKISGRGL